MRVPSDPTLKAKVADLEALQTAVVVVHADGSKTAYPPAADDDLARGAALAAAAAAAVSGDRIELATNTYELAANCYVTAGVTVTGDYTITGAGKLIWRKAVKLDNATAAGYVLPVYVTRGADRSEELLNGIALDGCRTDFSDVYFTDADGAKLNHCLISRGNYELKPDSSMGREQLIVTRDTPGLAKGDIVSGNMGTGGRLGISRDNGATWTGLGFDFAVCLVGIDRHGHIYASPYTGTGDYEGLYRGVYSTTTGEWTFTRVTLTPALHDIRVNTRIQQYAWAEDNSGGAYDGYIYIGAYHSSAVHEVYIWRSVDAGDTWTLAYSDTTTRQHVHGLRVDQVSGRVYAGINGVVNDALITSDDGGETWDDSTWAAVGYDCTDILGLSDKVLIGGGGAGANVGKTLFTLDRWAAASPRGVVLTATLKGAGTVQGLAKVNDVIFAAITTYGPNQYAKILASEDNGNTWKTIWVGPADSDNEFRGPTWFSNTGTPQGDDLQAILGCSKSGTPPVDYTPMRVYGGGDHYQALFYVVLPEIEAGGTTIYACYGAEQSNTSDPAAIFDTAALDADDDLLARWNFDAGDATDAVASYDLTAGAGVTFPVGNGNHAGALIPALTPYGRRASIPADNGMQCVASADGTDSLNLVESFTLAAWIRGTTAPMAQQKLICRGSGTSGTSGSWNLMLSETAVPTLKFYYNDAGTSRNVVSNPRLNPLDGAWHHVGVVVGPIAEGVQTVALFMDGILQAEQTLTGTVTAGSRHRIGVGTGCGDAGETQTPFTGDMDDVRIYGRVLTALEIESLYWGRMIAATPPEIQ